MIDNPPKPASSEQVQHEPERSTGPSTSKDRWYQFSLASQFVLLGLLSVYFAVWARVGFFWATGLLFLFGATCFIVICSRHRRSRGLGRAGRAGEHTLSVAGLF